jgi:hypothetical protein
MAHGFGGGRLPQDEHLGVGTAIVRIEPGDLCAGRAARRPLADEGIECPDVTSIRAALRGWIRQTLLRTHCLRFLTGIDMLYPGSADGKLDVCPGIVDVALGIPQRGC